MAERAARKSKRPASRRRSEAAGSSTNGAAGRQSQRIKALESERDRLKNQLKEAEERIKRLEECRAEAVNRIDWVIDSLHNVLDSGA